MTELTIIRAKLLNKANREKIAFLKNYMSTPYAFTYGLKVPDSREIAKEYKDLEMYDMYNLFDELWNSGNHEEMSLGIHILQLYRKKYNRETWEFLKKRLEKARTWDHVDWLATDIVSEMLVDGIIENKEIKEMAESRNPWFRRMAIESTYKLIKKNKLDLTFLLAEKLVYDEDKFVQKGVGWMLREAGKRQRIGVRDFIIRHIDMKATAFSYATEKMKELREMRKEKAKPFFIIIRGPAGVGKTTIARLLAERLRGEVIHIDSLLEAHGLDIVKEGEECIHDSKLLKVHKIIIKEVREKLKERVVIFDGNFYSLVQLEDLLKKLNKYRGFIFTLKADVEECLKRDKTRKPLGEKGIREVHALVSRFDSGVVMNTDNKSIEEVINDILSVLPK